MSALPGRAGDRGRRAPPAPLGSAPLTSGGRRARGGSGRSAGTGPGRGRGAGAGPGRRFGPRRGEGRKGHGARPSAGFALRGFAVGGKVLVLKPPPPGRVIGSANIHPPAALIGREPSIGSCSKTLGVRWGWGGCWR